MGQQLTNTKLFFSTLLLLLSWSASAQTQIINVLWYAYAPPTSAYRASISQIAASAHTYSQSSGLRWNLTYFGPNDPAPNFAAYNVLVIESGEAFRTNPDGSLNPPYTTPNYAGIFANKAAIAAARGDRTLISGSDADFHAIRRDTGNLAQLDPEHWDGALGYLVNAVNWAASGRGLGIVALYDGDFSGSLWWLNANSFLRNELINAGLTRVDDDSPFVSADIPLLNGITNAGLATWNHSFHGRFTGLAGYAPVVNSDSTSATPTVTLATAAYAEAPARPAAILEFSSALFNVNESAGSVTLTVRRSLESTDAVSATFVTSNGSATAPADYAARQGTVSFAAGDMTPKTITIPIVQDGIVEGAENFSVTLTGTSGNAILGMQKIAAVAIADDDTSNNTPPVARLVATPASGGAPVAVAFSGATSTDADGDALSYAWNFGDGSSGSGITVNHVYPIPGNYTVTLTATDTHSATGSTTAVITVSSSLGDVVFVDNLSTNTQRTGAWGVSSGPNPFRTNSLYATANSTFTWLPALPRSGQYDVYAWWTYTANRATVVPYRINHDGGVATVNVNQRVASLGGRWNFLGTYSLTQGVNGQITVASENGQTNADAVRLVWHDTKEIVVDNLDPGTTKAGTWVVSTGANPFSSNSIASNSAGLFTWSPNLPRAATYDVYAWWTYHMNRATNVPYQVTHNGGAATIFVNQRNSALGGRWNYLGTYAFTPGVNGQVSVSSENGQACADAVRLVPRD